MAEKTPEVDYAVLLYPPHGSPRVVKLPHATPEVEEVIPLVRFETRGQADAALEKFLTENPEYRHWRDGRLVPQENANADH